MAAAPTPRQMIETLVSFDTTSRESNLALIHFVRDYLASHDIESTLIHDETGRKANLFATVGPKVDGGVVLSGHTDVVPVDGQQWSSEPFSVSERDGRLYGRGTADMKSFSAIALALVPEMLQAGLKKPIHFALSYDEEVGCLGAHGLSEHLAGLPQRPQAMIVGEPTEMKVVNAHKGSLSYVTTVTGLEAHSSATHQGVNTIFYAAELIAFLRRQAEAMKTEQTGERFDPPYTTVHVGLVNGGTALNIIPKRTSFTWECRVVPGHDGTVVRERFDAFARDELLPEMRAVYPEADIVTEVRARVTPLVPQDGSPAETLVLALAGSNETHAVSYGTEAGIFQEGGVPAVVCGPGNIREAHKPDEYIELSQVEACTAFLRRLIDHLS
ncbi:MAG TPA: acetylornithine deacetylase [Alphaproteobacteria bacterium]|nr:acetylornithine deacetylase [Alphaproteobacteria bacterium]